MHRIKYLLLSISVSFQLFYCSNSDQIVNGSSSETVIGKIINNDGSPACSTIVTLYNHDYDPVVDHEYTFCSDTTDSNGAYLLEIPQDSSFYLIMATRMITGSRVLITNVYSGEKTTTLPDAVLKKPGTVVINLDSSNCSGNGYLYIPGTRLFTTVNDNRLSVTIDSVPAGTIPEIVFNSLCNAVQSMSRYSVVIEPGETSVISNPEWKYAKRIYLNTTSTGASISGDVCNFPVLLRFTQSDFDFSQTENDGSDIRFTGKDNTFFPYQVERWDPYQKQAEIWVTVDTIKGNNNNQFLIMYWGNSDYQNIPKSKPAFDTAKGFQGVWHLTETGGTTAFDATQNGYNGTPSGMTNLSSVIGIIGKAQDFNGTGSYIIMPNTAKSRIDFSESGKYSVSLWAYADLIDTIWHGIVSKGHQQYYLQYKCFRDTAASWEFVEFKNMGGWEYSEYRKTPAPGIRQWVYITGIRNGNRQSLYVNGEMVRDTALLNSTNEERNTECDFTIGCHLHHELLPVIQGWSFFDGKIDEVRIMSLVPSADWIKLCYLNQKKDDMLVEYR